jgi:thiol-disulfide isomerase/thioredoxin
MFKSFNFKLNDYVRNIILFVIGAVVIVGIVVLLRAIQKPSNAKPFLRYNNFENFSNTEWEEFVQDDKRVKIVLVYANWCPYCEEYLSDKASGSDKNVFDTAGDKAKGVVFEKLDAAENKTNQETANSYGVQGYPTIVAVKLDPTKNKYVKISTFDGNRNSVEELVAFAKEHSM